MILKRLLPHIVFEIFRPGIIEAAILIRLEDHVI